MRIVKNKKKIHQTKKKAVSQFCYVIKRIQTGISRNEEGYFETVKCILSLLIFICSDTKINFVMQKSQKTHNSKLILDFNTLKI